MLFLNFYKINMAVHNEIGTIGEQIALKYLQELGYEIILTNWQYKKFEIDIIAVDNNTVVFVEVKTRTNNVFGNPEDALTIAKQKQLIEGADYFLNEKELDMECRFDLITVIDPLGLKKLEHYENVFLHDY
ncbi:MAG: YraN family protein [Vicingaceae bacterium]